MQNEPIINRPDYFNAREHWLTITNALMDAHLMHQLTVETYSEIMEKLGREKTEFSYFYLTTASSWNYMDYKMFVIRLNDTNRAKANTIQLSI